MHSFQSSQRSQETTTLIGALDFATATLNGQITSDREGTATTDENDILLQPVLPWDNQDNSTSFAMFRLLEEITGCGISPILLLVGVSTNIVNCLVFYRQGLKERMNLCLFSLALIDMAFVVVFFLMHLNCLVGHFSPEAGQWWFYFTSKYLVGFHAGFLLSSGCLITIIAVDRCLCVTMPLKAATLVNTRTMAVIIVVIVIVIHAGCSLLPFSTDVVEMSHPVTGATVFILTYTRFYLDNKVLLKILIDIVLRIAIPFTSFAVVTAATAITVVQLKRAITWRATTGGGSDDNNVRQKSLAKMLVIVSCVFIVTAAPGVVLGLVSFTMPNIIPSGDDGNTYATAFLVYQVLTMVNSSVNFFIYVTRSARFRNTLRSFFVGQSGKSSQETMTVSMASEVSADHYRPRRFSHNKAFQLRRKSGILDTPVGNSI